MLLCSLHTEAQRQMADTAVSKPPDPLISGKRHFWRATGELAVAQLLPWSYNRYVRKAAFAKVSFSSIGSNLKPSSWEWDDNKFNTNQFAHPYHGNLYFSAFRSNGYTFWQSVPATFAGSFIWETAGETHRPAPNDFLNTSLGGIALGEVTYRLANKMIDGRARGARRQSQEILALLVNPVNGVNRIISGKWGRVSSDADSSIPLLTVIDAGGRRFSTRNLKGYTKGHDELYFRLRLQYGEKFEASGVPFSSFTAQIEAGAGDSAYLNTVQVNGALGSWNMKEGDFRHHLYSITMNYDFFKNSAFEYGAQSLNLKLISNWRKKSDLKVYTEIGCGAILLGAVPDKYLYYGEGRNYDYGPGISMVANATLKYKKLLEVECSYKGGRFQTVDGNKSSFILNTLTADARIRLPKRFSLAAGVGQFNLVGYYKDFDNVSERYPFLRFALGYHIE